MYSSFLFWLDNDGEGAIDVIFFFFFATRTVAD